MANLQISIVLSKFVHQSDSLFTRFNLRISGMDTWQSIWINSSDGRLWVKSTIAGERVQKEAARAGDNLPARRGWESLNNLRLPIV